MIVNIGKAWFLAVMMAVSSGAILTPLAFAEGDKKAAVKTPEETSAKGAKEAVEGKSEQKMEDKKKDKKSAKGKDKKMSTPDKFKFTLDTTKGKIVIEATRAWSPKGVDRLYELVQADFFKDIAFFRVVNGFVVQFGIHGDPKLSAAWKAKNIEDDPVVESNKEGYISFATAGPGTRTTQMFINLADNARLDGMGFSPVAKVVEGMDVVKKLYSGYGERPDQGAIQGQGNAYLKATFPEMDFVKSAALSK